ncbi:MAG TPA: zinc-binding dehydrogenase [Phaeodactylibacter sp.]|nr:zinc-binding dehydrogenase [Phaeodactylibacter sp.]
MRKYQLKAGNLSNMKIVETELSPPKAHEVSIAVKTIGLNFADVFAIWGLYSATPKGIFTPGLEYAGVVTATGAQVKGISIGDKVMGVTRFGAYTTHLNIDARYIVPLPKDWSMEQGAAFLVQVLTAYYAMVELGNLKKDHTVLVHSAAGGVGLHALHIAKRYGAYTIGTVGSPAKVDFLKNQGYDKVIVRSKHFGEDLKAALENRKLNLIMECIGGYIMKQGFQLLAPQGRLVIYGSARYAAPGDRPNYLKVMYQHLTRPKFDPQEMIHTNRAILGFNLIWLYEQVEIMHNIIANVNALQLPPPYIGHRFSFEKIPEAIRLFQTGRTVGKVVVKVDNG